MNKLISLEKIKEHPEKYVKWLCYDIYITTDLQVISLSFNKRFEKIKEGSYFYFCNGQYRTKGITIGKHFNSHIKTDKDASAIIYIGKKES